MRFVLTIIHIITYNFYKHTFFIIIPQCKRKRAATIPGVSDRSDKRATGGESQAGDDVQATRHHRAGTRHTRHALRPVPTTVRYRQSYTV